MGTTIRYTIGKYSYSKNIENILDFLSEMFTSLLSIQSNITARVKQDSFDFRFVVIDTLVVYKRSS